MRMSKEVEACGVETSLVCEGKAWMGVQSGPET